MNIPIFPDNLHVVIFSWSPECGPGQGVVADLGGAGDSAELLQRGLLASGHHHLVEGGQATRPHRPGGECRACVIMEILCVDA